MNLEKLITWSATVVLGFAAIGKLDTLQLWIWKAQARVVHESRASAWGSPRFLGSNYQLKNDRHTGRQKDASSGTRQ